MAAVECSSDRLNCNSSFSATAAAATSIQKAAAKHDYSGGGSSSSSGSVGSEQRATPGVRTIAPEDAGNRQMDAEDTAFLADKAGWSPSSSVQGQQDQQQQQRQKH